MQEFTKEVQEVITGFLTLCLYQFLFIRLDEDTGSPEPSTGWNVTGLF
jgi:hypothetical protein